MNVTAAIMQNSPPASAPPGKDAPRPAADSGNTLPSAGKSPPARHHAPPPVSIEKALEQIKTYLSDSKRQLNFQFDESSGRTIIKVVNPTSGEVIRQMPSEEVIKLAAIIDSQGFRTLNELA